MKLQQKGPRNKAFTLIELLVVIAIIGILSSIVLASLNTARAKARDARRLADMRTIENALQMYYLQYGSVPVTSAYGEVDAGTWDYSHEGGFMTFLQTSGILQQVPVDPLNNMVGDSASGYAYAYYCYTGENRVVLRMFKESPTRQEYFRLNTPGFICSN